MGIRLLDVLNAAPLSLYTPTTPYTKTGDNPPFNDLDNRADWFSNLYSKVGVIWQGTSTVNTLSDYSICTYDLDTNDIVLVDSATTVQMDLNQVPVIITPINLGAPTTYYGTNPYYYYCTVVSNAVDVPEAAFTYAAASTPDASRANYAEVLQGDVIYYWTDSVNKLCICPPGSRPTATTLTDYRTPGVPVALGIILGKYDTGGGTYFYTIKFRQMTGMGIGQTVGVIAHENVSNHTSLTDVAASTSADAGSWIYHTNSTAGGHYGYTTKIFTINSAASTGLSTGQVVELVSGAGAITLSALTADSECAGIYLGETDMTGSFNSYVLYSGIWDSSTASSGGTAGGFGVDLTFTVVADRGQEFWDAGAGAVTGTLPTYPAVRRRVGVKLDTGKYLIAPVNYYNAFMEEAGAALALDTGNSTDIQSATTWGSTPTSVDTDGCGIFPGRHAKMISGTPIQLEYVDTVDMTWAGNTTVDKAYVFALNESIQPDRQLHTVSAITAQAASAGRTWERYSGKLSSLTYSDTYKTLTLIGDSAFKIFLGAVRGTTPYDTLNKDNYNLNSDMSPQYTVGLPTCGVMMLVQAPSNAGYAMIFSYEGYTGYGTALLMFYNVTIIKRETITKTNDTVTSVFTPVGVGSDPGYTPEEYYDSTATTYLKYKNDTYRPNWTAANPGQWVSADVDNWYFKVMQTGGLRLRVKGAGSFAHVLYPEIGVAALYSTISTNSIYTGCSGLIASIFKSASRIIHSGGITNKPYTGPSLTTNATLDAFDNNQNTADIRSFWTPNTARTLTVGSLHNLPTDSVASLITAMPSTGTLDFGVGYMGSPAYPGTANTTYGPSVMWMDRKELWIDTAAYNSSTGISNLLFFTVSMPPGINTTSVGTTRDGGPDNLSIIEATIAQSGVNDSEDPKYVIDSFITGHKEFLDLIEGDSIRLFINNRAVNPTKHYSDTL
jgi:hypothetical protein